MIGIGTDDVSALFNNSIKNGATPVLDPIKKSWGQTVAQVRDCNGFIIEIFFKI